MISGEDPEANKEYQGKRKSVIKEISSKRN